MFEIALCVIAIIVTILQFKHRNKTGYMWVLIVLYWAVLSAKNLWGLM